VVSLSLVADLHDGAAESAGMVPDVLNSAIRQRHAVSAYHVAVCVRLPVFTVIYMSVRIMHAVGELEGMPLFIVLMVAVVSVMGGQEVTEDQVLYE